MFERQYNELYSQLNKAVHSSVEESDFDRMVECRDEGYCPIVNLVFLPISSEKLLRTVGYVEELYSLASYFVVAVFPAISNQEEVVLQEFFDQDSIADLKRLSVPHSKTDSVTFGDCLKKRAYESDKL